MLKVCKGCGRTLDVSAFTVDKRLKDGRFGKCKECCRPSKLYRKWIDMRTRCYNKNNCNYKHYGARGISVCDEWRNSFQAFETWALKNGYSETLSIDRIDNNGNYEPSNCRWANRSVQGMSTRHKNTSGYIGISKHSSGPFWYGRIKVDGNCYYTGISTDKDEAARMRDEYILKNGFPNALNGV